jgi:hypothetical protein
MEAGGPGLNLPAMGSLHICFTFIANARFPRASLLSAASSSPTERSPCLHHEIGSVRHQSFRAISFWISVRSGSPHVS